MNKKVLAGTLDVGCAAPLALVAEGGVLAIGMFAGGSGDNSAICSDSSVSVTIDGDRPSRWGPTRPKRWSEPPSSSMWERPRIFLLAVSLWPS